MAEFKFKKNPKSINLESVTTGTMPMCCGGGEAYCEGKVIVTYDDKEQETFYLSVMINLCPEWEDDDEEKEKCACSSSNSDVLSQFPDDKFCYAVTNWSGIPGVTSVEDMTEAIFNSESMFDAFASPFGDIFRKLTVEYAVFTGMMKETDGEKKD